MFFTFHWGAAIYILIYPTCCQRIMTTRHDLDAILHFYGRHFLLQFTVRCPFSPRGKMLWHIRFTLIFFPWPFPVVCWMPSHIAWVFWYSDWSEKNTTQARSHQPTTQVDIICSRTVTQRRTGDGEFKNICIWLKVELVSGIITQLPHKAGFGPLDDNLTNYDKEKKSRLFRGFIEQLTISEEWYFTQSRWRTLIRRYVFCFDGWKSTSMVGASVEFHHHDTIWENVEDYETGMNYENYHGIWSNLMAMRY